MAPLELERMRRLGIQWARADFTWRIINPEKGKWDFSKSDKIVRQAEKSDIKLLPILDYDVAWASPAYKHLDEWTTYVRKVVTRYQDLLRYWEVWNEPNIQHFWNEEPDPEAYAKLLAATYETIK